MNNAWMKSWILKFHPSHKVILRSVFIKTVLTTCSKLKLLYHTGNFSTFVREKNIFFHTHHLWIKYESGLIIPPRPCCEAAAITSCQWHRKQKTLKYWFLMVALILNGSSLWVLLCESCSNELHWLIWAFEEAAVGPVSIFLLILIQSQYVAFSTIVHSFFLHSELSVSWQWCSDIKQVCQCNTDWHVLNSYFLL